VSEQSVLELPSISAQELGEIGRLFEQWALESMAKMEELWRSSGQAFAWIDQKPTHMEAADWGSNAEFWVPRGQPSPFPQPVSPVHRVLRLVLQGGGQIRSTETYRLRNQPDNVLGLTWRSSWELRIRAHENDLLTDAVGRVFEGYHGEMNQQAVLFAARHQAIADRVAATLRLIDSNIDNLWALIDSTEGCGICGRALRDPISKLLGIGPNCARQHRLEHSRAAAERRLAKRRELLLGEAVSC
jgi:hypothetical protein